jgi:hypothetical protein
MHDPENLSASVHRKRFLTPSLPPKFLCTGELNPRLVTTRPEWSNQHFPFAWVRESLPCRPFTHDASLSSGEGVFEGELHGHHLSHCPDVRSCSSCAKRLFVAAIDVHRSLRRMRKAAPGASATGRLGEAKFACFLRTDWNWITHPIDVDAVLLALARSNQSIAFGAVLVR